MSSNIAVDFQSLIEIQQEIRSIHAREEKLNSTCKKLTHKIIEHEQKIKELKDFNSKSEQRQPTFRPFQKIDRTGFYNFSVPKLDAQNIANEDEVTIKVPRKSSSDVSKDLCELKAHLAIETQKIRDIEKYGYSLDRGSIDGKINAFFLDHRSAFFTSIWGLGGFFAAGPAGAAAGAAAGGMFSSYLERK